MTDPYSAGGGRRQGGQSHYDALDPYTRESAGTPIWGWLSGQGAQVDAARAQDAADQNRSYWDALQAPSESQLRGPTEDRDAQMSALQQLQQWGRGGVTAADRAGLEGSRERDAQASGAQQGALMQQAQARGVGGGGLDYGTRQQAAQAGQQRSSDAESQMMQGAQQRALGAIQAQGQLAGNIRGQDTDATQQAFTDASQIAAGATGQYSTDVGSANARAGRDQQRDQSIFAAIGAALA
jgi:hypothetical protein